MSESDSIETEGPLRLLIAERTAGGGSLSDLLVDREDIEVVGSVRKAIEALAMVEKLCPEAVLLDIDMPGETLGFLLNLIKQSPAPPAVIVVIPYASVMLREQSLDAGADYVVARTHGPEYILNTLQKLNHARRARLVCT